jgi:hypothetical protein
MHIAFGDSVATLVGLAEDESIERLSGVLITLQGPTGARTATSDARQEIDGR